MTVLDSASVVHCFRAPVGGLFRHVRDLVRGQAARGLKVGVICDASTGGGFAEAELAALREHCHLGILRIPIPRLPHPGDVIAFRKALAYCRSRRPDVIHGHGAKGGSLARLLGAVQGAAAVYTPHGGALHYDGNSAVGLVYLGIEKLLRRYTQGYVFESEFSAREFAAKVGPTSVPVRVVHNGLAEHELVPICPRGDAPLKDFVFIGELRDLKGVSTLLEALARLRSERDVSLIVAGAGPDESRFRELAARLEVADAVEFRPPIHPATDAFAEARCLVVPSWAESLPYIVLEAAGAGMPMLTTRVGGIPEIFGSLSDRLLPPQDPEALAAAMRRVLEEPCAARDLAFRLRKHVARHFRCETMVGEITEFYSALRLEQQLAQAQ